MQVNSGLLAIVASQSNNSSPFQLKAESSVSVNSQGKAEDVENTKEESSFLSKHLHDLKHGDTDTKVRASAAIAKAQQNGEIHPLGEHRNLELPEGSPHDPRFLREGGFGVVKGPLEGEALVVRDAVMGDRQGALMNAYHYGSDLLKANEGIERKSGVIASRNAEISALKEQLTAGEGDSEYSTKKIAWLENNIKHMNQSLGEDRQRADRAMASLSRLFSQADNGLDGATTATPESGGFEITHGTYGKLMEVSDDGSITMFDREGNGYSREEFVEKKPEGMIGEIHNDLIREEDRRQWKVAREERHEKIRNGEIEGSWILEVTEDMFI